MRSSSPPVAAAATDAGSPPSAGRRLALALAMLVAEGLVLTTAFDAADLAPNVALFGAVGPGLALALVAATAVTALVVGRRKAAVEAPAPARWMLPAGLHAACFAALVALWGAASARLGPPLPLLVASLGVTVVALGALLATAIAPRAWRSIVYAHRGAIASGLGVGGLAWAAGLASARLWGLFSGATLELVALVLGLFTSPVIYEPSPPVVGTTTFYVEIAPECAGYEGLGLILVLAAAWLVAEREHLRFPQALVLLPIALGLVYLANVLRIAALVGVGSLVDPDLALGAFHSKAGWVFFCAIALGLLVVARRWSFVARDPVTGDAPNPAAPFLVPFLLFVGAGLVTGLWVSDVDRLYGLRIALAAGALWVYRHRLGLARDGFRPPSPFAVALGVVTFALWWWLSDRPAAHEVAAWRAGLNGLGPAGGAAWLAVRTLGSVVVVPVVEELAFRSYLYRRIQSADVEPVPLDRLDPLALLGSSVAFGLVHGSPLAGAVAGLVFALAMLRRGRVEDAIVAHVVANVLVAAAALLGGQWWLWV